MMDMIRTRTDIHTQHKSPSYSIHCEI